MFHCQILTGSLWAGRRWETARQSDGEDYEFDTAEEAVDFGRKWWPSCEVRSIQAERSE